MILQTSLTEEHQKLKAKMGDFAGFTMPLQYTTVKEEVAAVRNNVGVFDVSHMGEFIASGKDAVSFVDYLITNDFKNAGLHKAVYSPLCREDGTVVDDLIAYKIGEERVLICVNAANIEKDWNFINQYTNKFSELKLENHSENYSLLALQGPKTEEILRKLEIPLPGEFPYYSANELAFEGEKIIIARTGYTGEDGVEIFCSNELVHKLWSKMLELEVRPCGLVARDVLRLEVCYPLYGHEINDKVTPLDAALKWTVKLDKEDFVSKKALNEHKATHRLVKLSLEKGIPREGYKILNEKEEEIGVVTSGTMSTTLTKGVCLGHVKADLFPKDKSFKIQVRNQAFAANYHTKAFIAGGHK